MAVKRRVVWLSDEQWEKIGERAGLFGLSRSAYIAKLIEWRQPGGVYIEEAGERGKEPLEDRAFTEFRPVPKPSKRK